MATYYVDPMATGSDDGSSWTNAWVTLQTAADTAVAGDVVYCRGTETLSSKIDFDINSGNTTSGFIKFIGCNASGTNDGTMFLLDGNSAAPNGVYVNGRSYLYFENIRVINCTGAGFGRASAYWRSCVFYNCHSENNSSGFDLYYDNSTGEGNWYIKCLAKGNTNAGFYGAYRTAMLFFCSAINNGGDGFDLFAANVRPVIIGCISHNNDSGFKAKSGLIFNCVSDGNTDSEGFVAATASDVICSIGNRFTNNATYGANLNVLSLLGWCFSSGNTAGQNNGSFTTLLDGGVDTNETTGTIGYNYQANDDFNLASSATMRDVAITLPE